MSRQFYDEPTESDYRGQGQMHMHPMRRLAAEVVRRAQDDAAEADQLSRSAEQAREWLFGPPEGQGPGLDLSAACRAAGGSIQGARQTARRKMDN